MDYITIKEYAERAHISQQTAYKRAKNAKYQGYFRKIKGVIMVDSALLEFNHSFNGDSTVENETAQAAARKSFNGNSTEFSTVESAFVSVLQEQLERQSQQIEKLYTMIAEKDSIIKDLSANMAQITAQIQALQHEQNLLEAGRAQAETPPPVENIPTEKESKAETVKKGFFSRLRRR